MFGITPPELAGRDEQVREFARSLANGVGYPGRATLYVGPLGLGNTSIVECY